jgi:hypothetical protein
VKYEAAGHAIAMRFLDEIPIGDRFGFQSSCEKAVDQPFLLPDRNLGSRHHTAAEHDGAEDTRELGCFPAR